MKNKGFTLIELLAVIVILAIIALIATPIILNIINDSKVESKKRSAENYFDAVELAVANKNLEGKFNPSKCTISAGTKKLICEGEFDAVHCPGQNECIEPELNVKVDGEIPTEATIEFENGKVADGSTITIGNVPLIKEKGKFKTVKTEEKPKEEPEDDIEEGPEHLAKENVKAVNTPTTGIVPVVENGNLKPGSEFQIKVNNNSDWLTFFVLSNDGEYVNLIAQQNITIDGTFTSEPQDEDQWYVSISDNRYGPQTAYTYLSDATSKWTNIPIIESFNYEEDLYKFNDYFGYQSMKTELDEQRENYITIIIPNSDNYGDLKTYKNLRTRLPYDGEITQNTSCSEGSSDYGSCPIWMINYLSDSEFYTAEDGKVKITNNNLGYWTLSASGTYQYASYVSYCGYVSYFNTNNNNVGIRPVITILKSDLLRVM